MDVRRDDLIHPLISGNKWRKLKYNLQEARRQEHDTLLTFGGAFSNHIVATAVCAALSGLKSIGIIRGERAYASNPTLSLAAGQGMQLHFVSRADYKRRHERQYLEELSQKFGRCLIIPEGGANELGREGCKEIISTLHATYDFAVVAMGTGTTFLGMLDASANGQMRIIGIPVIKNFTELDQYLASHFNAADFLLMKQYHFGGYARFSMELVTFINQFRKETGIALDPIYTGKMMFGIFDLLSSGFFPVGSKILAIHTGGLQGIRGFNQMHGALIDE